MKKILHIVVFLITFFSIEKTTYAQVTEHHNNSRLKVYTTSYPDYKPFFYKIDVGNYKEYVSFLTDFISDILSTNNIYTDFSTLDTYEDNIQSLKEGNHDLLVGVYNETNTDVKVFEHIDYMYPAFLQNPVNLIMLPKNVSKIKSMEDLKKLKGVYVAEEYFSDYVYAQLDKLNVEKADNTLNAYKDLFSQKIDYIIGSYYYHYIQSVELGIKDYISFSKKPIWNMPMFMGISKRSKNYQRLKVLLYKKVASPDFSNTIKEKLKEHIKEIETKSIGVVPPTFISDYNNSNIEIY